VGRTEGLWLEELRTSFATSKMEHRKDRAIRPSVAALTGGVLPSVARASTLDIGRI
jgi:hypothetical protein